MIFQPRQPMRAETINVDPRLPVHRVHAEGRYAHVHSLSLSDVARAVESVRPVSAARRTGFSCTGSDKAYEPESDPTRTFIWLPSGSSSSSKPATTWGISNFDVTTRSTGRPPVPMSRIIQP